MKHGRTDGLHTAEQGMQIDKALEVFCLVEDIDQSLDIFLEDERGIPRLASTRATNV